MLRSMVTPLSLRGPHGRRGAGAAREEALGEVRLVPPPHLSASLGWDAVGCPSGTGCGC